MPSEKNKQQLNIVNDLQSGYKKAEMDLLRDALRRTHEERFLMMTCLYKMQQTMTKATITHHPSPDK